MSKEQIHIRIGPLTADHLKALTKCTGMTRNEVIALAIDRMWQLELLKSTDPDDSDQPGWW